jgi:hypothetical protein
MFEALNKNEIEKQGINKALLWAENLLYLFGTKTKTKKGKLKIAL